jgi:hypothetical protein
MVTSRSYMTIEPIELWLDRASLRRGLIVPVHPETDPTALLLQDSGMVPVSTQISVVNPESNRLCMVGEYGEIWVQSEANVHSFYGSKDPLDSERFNGRTMDGDVTLRYVRTGDLGFLHNVSRAIGPGGGLVEMQVLFVLGSIGETFEVNGLCHFPVDIEASVERCHRNIVQGGCAVFQAGGLAVVLVEVDRKQWLASIVPVIVNSVLNSHHFIVDIVAFVSKGDFPRSRLGEKQRGKILASWVTRKMRTVAQFAIRDPDADDDHIGHRRGLSSGHRASTSSQTLYSTGNPSMSSRGVSMTLSPLDYQNRSPAGRESILGMPQGMQVPPPPPAQMAPGPPHMPLPQPPQQYPTSQPIQIQQIARTELPAAYPPLVTNIAELPGDEGQVTPTVIRRPPNQQRIYQETTSLGYSPIDRAGPFSMDSPSSIYSQHNLHAKASNPSLAKAALNLPGSLLPPSAIADLRAAAAQDAEEDADRVRGPLGVRNVTEPIELESPTDTKVEMPPQLPSYVQKPYLAMLSEEEGREGRLPISPPRSNRVYGSGRPSEDSSRSSRPGTANMAVGARQGSQDLASQQVKGKAGNRESTFLGNDQEEWPTEALMHMGIGVSKGPVRRKDVPGSAGSGSSRK